MSLLLFVCLFVSINNTDGLSGNISGIRVIAVGVKINDFSQSFFFSTSEEQTIAKVTT